MDRMTCMITDDNRRRLEILKAFAAGSPTIQDIVNRSIEEFFASVYGSQRGADACLMEAMEALLPQECRSRRNGVGGLLFS